MSHPGYHRGGIGSGGGQEYLMGPPTANPSPWYTHSDPLPSQPGIGAPPAHHGSARQGRGGSHQRGRGGHNHSHHNGGYHSNLNNNNANTGGQQQQHTQPSEPTENLFICYLPTSFNDHRLQALVSQYGIVVSAKVMLDLHTKQSRGFGFALMASKQDASRAKEHLEGMSVDGKVLQVRFAAPPANDRPDGDVAVVLPASHSGPTNLYVKGIPVSWRDEQVTQFFSRFGTVLSAVVLMEGKESKGIALVRLESKESVEAVLRAAPLRVEGWPQPITVRFSRQQQPTVATPGTLNPRTGAESAVPAVSNDVASAYHAQSMAPSATSQEPHRVYSPTGPVPILRVNTVPSATTANTTNHSSPLPSPMGISQTHMQPSMRAQQQQLAAPDQRAGSVSSRRPSVETSGADVGQTPPLIPRSSSSSDVLGLGGSANKMIPGPFGLLLRMNNPYFSAQKSGSGPSSPEGLRSPAIVHTPPLGCGTASPRLPHPTTSSSSSTNFAPSATAMLHRSTSGKAMPPVAPHRGPHSPSLSSSGIDFHPVGGTSSGGGVNNYYHSCQYCQLGTTIRMFEAPIEQSHFEQWVENFLSGYGAVIAKEVYHNGTALITFVDSGAAHMAMQTLMYSQYRPELYDCTQGQYVG